MWWLIYCDARLLFLSTIVFPFIVDNVLVPCRSLFLNCHFRLCDRTTVGWGLITLLLIDIS